MAMCAAQEAARLHKTPQQDSVQPGFGRGRFVKFRPTSGELNFVIKIAVSTWLQSWDKKFLFHDLPPVICALLILGASIWHYNTSLCCVAFLPS